MINISIVKTIDTNGATIFKLDPSVIKIGNQSANLVDTIQFDNIPEEWDGCTVRAVFIPGVSAAVACLLDENHQVEVSAGFTKARGVLVVDAFNASEYHAYTTNCQYTIANHANIANTIDPEYTPTQVEQILAQAQTYANSAIDARDAAQGYAEDAAASAAEIEDMTVSASTLPAGSAATVTKTETQTGISLDFGIPRGADGQVQDVTIDGNSIVDADHVANIPKADYNVAGAVKINSAYGIYMRNDGAAAITLASDANIDSRTQSYKPIVPYNLDYAVKAAMTDGRGAAWTAAEKANAQTRIDGNWVTLDNQTTTEDLTEYNFYPTDNVYRAARLYMTCPSGQTAGGVFISEIFIYMKNDNAESAITNTFLGGQRFLVANFNVDGGIPWIDTYGSTYNAHHLGGTASSRYMSPLRYNVKNDMYIYRIRFSGAVPTGTEIVLLAR